MAIVRASMKTATVYSDLQTVLLELALAYSSKVVHIHSAESSQLVSAQDVPGKVVNLLWQTVCLTVGCRRIMLVTICHV
jgi:hypothetical protein